MTFNNKTLDSEKIRNYGMLLTAASSVKIAFAADLSKITEAITSLYQEILPVIVAVAILALAICAFCYFFSKNERRADEAFQWGKRIIIGVVVVVAAPLIIKYVLELFGSLKEDIDIANWIK